MKCPSCFEANLETKNGDYLEGKYLIHDATWEECPNCGEKLFGPDMMDKLQKAYYFNNNLIFPEDIKKRRVNCGKTQLELARAVGASANTIKRWEKGSYIQSADKNQRMQEIFSQWQNETLSGISTDSWVASLMKKDYRPDLAYASNTEGNVPKQKEADMNDIIKKIR